MKKEGVGARKACTVMQWEHVKVTTLDSRRRGKSKASMDGTQTKILTLAEEEQLCIWIKVQGQNLGGANRQAVARKVVEIIKLRKATQKAAGINGGRKFVGLSPPAKVALSMDDVGTKWVKTLYKRHSAVIREVTPNSQDASRLLAANESTVEVHFNGEFGVVQTLIKHGIMNDDGEINDKRRVVNLDESPQFAEFNGNCAREAKVGAAVGQTCVLKGAQVNRECHSIDACIGLDGFLYGHNIIVARNVGDSWVHP
jgi:hypothetical protein